MVTSDGVNSPELDTTRPQLLPFPTAIPIGDDELVLRWLQSDDGEGLRALARGLPPEDRLLLRRDITDELEVQTWLDEALVGLAPTIVVVADDEIVGYVLLATERLSWARHLAEVRVMVAPAWRGHGLGSLLVTQAVALAHQRGLRKLVAQTTPDQVGALGAFLRHGFVEEAELPDRVIDRQGGLHALRVLGMEVASFDMPSHSLIDAARGSHEQSIRWDGTAELLDPNGIVVAEVAATLWKLSAEGRGSRWGGELTSPARIGLAWSGDQPPSELRLSTGRSAHLNTLGAVRVEADGAGGARHLAQISGRGEPPF